MKALDRSSEQDPSVIAVTSLVLPLLQFLSLPTSGPTTDSCKPVISLAAKILKSIEDRIKKLRQKETQVCTSYIEFDCRARCLGKMLINHACLIVEFT